MDFSQIERRQVKIPIGDLTINAQLILPKAALQSDGTVIRKLPLLFFNHGWGNNIDFILMQQYAAALAMGGPYAVLIYDCRGHGKTSKHREFTQEIFDDIPHIIDYGENIPDIDADRMGFIGISMGGEIALSRAYPDPRIKAVVAICSPSNAKKNFGRTAKSINEKLQLKFIGLSGVKHQEISEEMNRSISPEFIIDPNNTQLNQRVMLIHARNDMLIAVEECQKNRDLLGLPPENVVILENGGHAFFKQELNIVANALRFFHAKL
jgi:pimeloyl-ACP methyl ester carboxylesterase